MSYGKGDDADQADVEIANNLRIALSKIHISKVEQCKSGNTIICCECGEDIPLPRLKALPKSHLCVGCAATLEEV